MREVDLGRVAVTRGILEADQIVNDLQHLFGLGIIDKLKAHGLCGEALISYTNSYKGSLKCAGWIIQEFDNFPIVLQERLELKMQSLKEGY